VLRLKTYLPLLSVGSSQYITAPTPARTLTFDLHLDTPVYDEEETFARIQDSESRLMEMVAAQAHHRQDGTPGQDEDAIATDDSLSDDEKREILQKGLNMAASNGDVSRIQKLVGGKAKQYVDVNQPDEEGTVPLIYASCFVRCLETNLSDFQADSGRDIKKWWQHF
jgi:hypothetical protein